MAAPIRPRLEELPEELVSNIVVRLDIDSSFAFRLTCKALEHKSLHEWATEYFTAKAVIPSSSSLKALVSIAESDKLRNYLHHIYVLPALFSKRVLGCCNGATCKRKHTVRQAEAIRGYVDDQKDLKQNGRLLELFSHVIAGCSALHGVTFTDSVSSVPAETNIHGYASFTRRTNSTLITLPIIPKDKEFYAWRNHVWKTLMKAIAFSGISTLKVLHITLDSVKNPLTLSDLNFSDSILHHLDKALRNVECLRLPMTSRSDNYIRSYYEVENPHLDTVRYKGSTIVKKFAKLMQSIQQLDITFSDEPEGPQIASSLLNHVDLSKLTKLRVEGLNMGSKPLGVIICKLTNAESLFLEWVNLTKGTWPAILEAILKIKGLKHLHLNYLTVPSGSACFLKRLEQEDAARDATYPDWAAMFGVGGDQGAAPALHAEGSSGSEFVTDDEDSDADTDDDMPNLESPTHNNIVTGTSQGITDALPFGDVPAAAAAHLHSHSSHQHNHRDAVNAHKIDPDSLESRLGRGSERGHVICLNSGEEVQQLIPTFIKEYHIVDVEGEDGMWPLPGGLGVLGAGGMGLGPGGHAGGANAGPIPPPPPGVNAVVNQLNTLFGPPIDDGHGGMTFTGTIPAAGGPPVYFGPQPPPQPSNATTTTANATQSNEMNGAGGSTAPQTSADFAATVEDDWTDEDLY